MADRPDPELAARFKVAIDRKLAEKKRQEEQRRRREEQARRARADLLADLASFGRAVGHLDVTEAGGTVVLRLDDRALRFEATGDTDQVAVKGDGIDGDVTLFLQDTLSRWAMRHTPKRGQERVRLLFDGGLEALMGRVFGLEPADPDEIAGEPPPRVDGEDTPRRTL